MCAADNTSPDSNNGTFANLVKHYSGDIPTKAMLNLLEASRCVEVKDGQVRSYTGNYSDYRAVVLAEQSATRLTRVRVSSTGRSA